MLTRILAPYFSYRESLLIVDIVCYWALLFVMPIPASQGDDHMVIRTFISIDGHLCRQIDFKGRTVLLDALNRYELRKLTRQFLQEVRS